MILRATCLKLTVILETSIFFSLPFYMEKIEAYRCEVSCPRVTQPVGEAALTTAHLFRHLLYPGTAPSEEEG